MENTSKRPRDESSSVGPTIKRLELQKAANDHAAANPLPRQEPAYLLPIRAIQESHIERVHTKNMDQLTERTNTLSFKETDNDIRGASEICDLAVAEMEGRVAEIQIQKEMKVGESQIKESSAPIKCTILVKPNFSPVPSSSGYFGLSLLFFFFSIKSVKDQIKAWFEKE
jgi:hypothetical protein